MDLNDLPDEVLNLILGQLIELKEDLNDAEHYGELTESKEELAKARFVCRRWNSIATEHLFQEVVLKHHPRNEEDENSSSDANHGDGNDSGKEKDKKGHEFTPWENLLNLESARKLARCAVIESCPAKLGEFGDWEIMQNWEENSGYPRFYHAIDRIRELPNIKSLNIRFSERCFGKQSTAQDAEFAWDADMEPMATRKMTLSKVLETIRRRAEDNNTAQIRSLSLENLQNTPLPGFDWEAVAMNVNELHLMIAVEYQEHGSGYDIEMEECWTFEPYLQTSILPHFADNLTVLTLGFLECRGAMPGYFDGKGLLFPRLNTLNLINFVVAHNDHFDWVLSQTSVETLRLERCHIVSHIYLMNRFNILWGLLTHDWEQYPEHSFGFTFDDDLIYHFPRTWETTFDQIKAKLPKLAQFQFDSADGYRFRHPEVLGARLYPNRYIAFNCGLHPSPWITTSQHDGEMEFGNNVSTPVNRNSPRNRYVTRGVLNRAKETEVGDGRAFEELLATVRARRDQCS
ncbi:F-box domain-containing protein [Colletotrichum sojae]|uniref:F-box domain-containing protein n=1 Tax=Colletotrichum sojae TaxID=2175907 RepID=A0A8H6MIY8_9PEZI|nr:F-box domain-containing protein [Colletotrichum sojae]